MTARPGALRLALAAAALAASACHERKPGPAPSPSVVRDGAAPLPPVSVPFRWSAPPLDCETQFELRSGVDRCRAGDGSEVSVRAGAGPAATLELDGHRGARGAAWTATLPVSSARTAPVVAVVPDAGVAIVAAPGAADVEVVLVELVDGTVRARGTVPVAGVRAVQLERRRQGDLLRVHLRGPGDGATALVDVVTGSIVGLARTPAAAIRDAMTPGARSADGDVTVEAGGDTVTAAWEGGTLSLRVTGRGDAAPRWQAVMMQSSNPFRSELITLHVAGGQVVGTLHHPSASWTQVFAYALADGSPAWRETITGVGPMAHSAYLNRVASRVDGDDLVVYGVESGGSYVCSVELATGRERACVDVDPATAIEPDAPLHLPPVQQPAPRPLGPRTTSVTCRPSSSPERRMSVRRSSAVDLTGYLVAPSTSCAPTLSGGIAGDRIELTYTEGAPAAAPCECRLAFRQDYRPESKTIIVTAGGTELVREPVPGWSP